MNHKILLFLLIAVFATTLYPQNRNYRTHSRSMLRETVFNTGEIGRAFDRGTAGVSTGFSSMEWPPNSRFTSDGATYEGQHNSFGGGMWISGNPGMPTDSVNVQYFDYCGGVTANNGDATRVEGVYSDPISIERIENYPVLANGNLNPSYNPDEAEEIIISKWKTHTLGVTVTRTSRAWSFPGYDDFIIFEYEIENTTSATITDMFVAFPYGFGPSMFGYVRAFNRWGEGDYRASQQFARFDLKRWMTYNHDREGKPEADANRFNDWSTPGNRGGLNSPQAAGLVTLHYDYDHLALKGQTTILVNRQDSMVAWDENNKMKQPYLNRYENANVYPTKIQAWLDPATDRKTGPFQGRNDSIYFLSFAGPDGQPGYWIGRGKPSWTLGNAQPVAHGYGFGPYTLPAGEKMRFSFAEVVGYGAGVASDSIYQDLGGGIRNEPVPGLHPIPSWYQALTYANVGNPPVMGSNYLQTHSLPWYVDPDVISIRDVADRAIQIYKGGSLIKYDTLQLEPRTTPEIGIYNTVSIPVPSPAIEVKSTPNAVNQIVWGPQVESFSHPRLHGSFKHYEVYRASDPLGPWTLYDSVSARDSRIFTTHLEYTESVYVWSDHSSLLGRYYYYSVISVDSLGGKSGFLNNMELHRTDIGPALTLGKVYVVPNPLVVTNGLTGESSSENDALYRIQFFGLTKRCTIRIYSYSGQLVNTIEHDEYSYFNDWYQISRNNQLIASGVYFFVVEDESGARSQGKFVVIR